jgi:predicted O-methyltransferase YrrM
MGSTLAAILPQQILIGLVDRTSKKDANIILQALGPRLNRKPTLDSMPKDLPLLRPIHFEDLSGLFASTSLDHAVIAMTIRQTAYIFGLVRHAHPKKVVEIGRFKGGSTLVIAAAMNGEGEFWSIDVGEKESRRIHNEANHRSYDEQLRDLCSQLGLKVHIIGADSRTVELDTGELDLVFIDGDHSYEGVKNDFERFGRRAAVGGAVLFDDAFPEEVFASHSETVGRLVTEIVAEGEFRLVKTVNRLAHLERTKPATFKS